MPSGRKGEDSQVGKVQRFNIEDEDFYSKIFLQVIDRVIEHMSDWSASAISTYSHNDMPWLASKEGEKISYELVFFREPPFSVRNYGDEIE